MNSSISQDIIVAPATLTGGAIAIVRLSGDGSIELCNSVFKGRKGDRNRLISAAGYTLHYGEIVDGERTIDDVMVSIFRTPHSYTGEDSVEISCHGSHYIVQEIINLLLNRGARAADHGEFTIRAFLAGRMDLSQAEAVADMIASSSKAQHAMASTQMRGGYSARFSELRNQLLELVALLELELDFSEEEVEFADRTKLQTIIDTLLTEIKQLTDSFALGNAIKEGVQVAIVGEPNVGKSTLLNRLLNDERAMVSDIAGTTRDLIEEELRLNGILFRFIDTAGVHDTTDRLEKMGIERTHSAIERAQIIIHLIDGNNPIGATTTQDSNKNQTLTNSLYQASNQHIINVINKIDLVNQTPDTSSSNEIYISAKDGNGIDQLINTLCAQVDTTTLYEGAPIVSNSRHYELLTRATTALTAANEALHTNLPTDLLSQDIREALHHLGTITGEITTNDILGEIFSKFCIGK